MSEGRTAAGLAARMGSRAGRLVRAWRVMPHERRLAVCASVGLFLTMFLPWYQRQFFVVFGSSLHPGSDSQTAWAQFSFVEAAVLLVAAGVLTLLFQRAEGKAFHLPGGDGWVITAAGVWTCVLIIWRIFDRQGGSAHGQSATTYGIEWGIFIALAVAALLAYAGSRIRAAHRPEPPLPGERSGPGAAELAATSPRPASPRPASPRRPPAPATSDSGEPSHRRREVGWLSTPRDRDEPAPAPRRIRSPRPVAADDPQPGSEGSEAPTLPKRPRETEAPALPKRPRETEAPTLPVAPSTLPVAPSTPAARRRRRPPPDDDQPTIPRKGDE